jgi:hypothetical protein
MDKLNYFWSVLFYMVYVDLNEYYRYTNNVVTYEKNPTKNDVPYVLEHVFDLDKEGYVSDSNQCCYHTPVNIDGLSFEVENKEIVDTDGVDLIAKNIGSTYLTVKTVNEYSYRIKVNVYNGVFRGKLIKDTLFIEKDTIISLKYVLRHIHCKHYNNCIWDRDYFRKYEDEELFEIDYNIQSIKQKIKDFKNISECYRNGEVIYHEDLKEYYDINILKDGSNYHIDYNISETFLDGIKDKIKELEQLLKDYNRLKFSLES